MLIRLTNINTLEKIIENIINSQRLVELKEEVITLLREITREEMTKHNASIDSE